LDAVAEDDGDQSTSSGSQMKKLLLNNLFLTANDIPNLADLADSLHTLSLAGNARLGIVPRLQLPALNTLNLSQCGLRLLPASWDLPQLRRLDLSYNHLTEFPDAVRGIQYIAFSFE